jgi:hypothetical protein
MMLNFMGGAGRERGLFYDARRQPVTRDQGRRAASGGGRVSLVARPLMTPTLFRPALSLLVLCALLAAAACQRAPRPPSHPSGPELVEAGAGPADEVVRTALADAQRDGRRLLVYVSASWCEPCERFQKAVRAGELDAYFPRLRLLKFDHDRDVGRLEAAGYAGRLIPRFVIPGPDGRGTDHRMEGGTKAADTVSTSIGPRLQRLLNETPGG